jgi:hypothetical protein
MMISPSRVAISSAATQELLSTTWKPKINFRVHKNAPLVPMLIQINPIHTTYHIPLKRRFIYGLHDAVSSSVQFSKYFFRPMSLVKLCQQISVLFLCYLQPVCEADSLTAYCDPIVLTIWDPQYLRAQPYGPPQLPG